jgi:hypothetical protein
LHRGRQNFGGDQYIDGPMDPKIGGTGPPGPHGGCAYAMQPQGAPMLGYCCVLCHRFMQTLANSTVAGIPQWPGIPRSPLRTIYDRTTSIVLS